MAGQPLYEVEQLLDRKVLPTNRVVYLVRWRGFSSDHDSWEPYSNLQTCGRLIRTLNKTLRQNPSNHVVHANLSPSKHAVENASKKPGPKKGMKKIQPITHNKNSTLKKSARKVLFSGLKVRNSKYNVKFATRNVKTQSSIEKPVSPSGDSEKPPDMDSSNRTSNVVSKPGQKGIKRRKLENDGSDKGSGKIRKKKKQSDENIHKQMSSKGMGDNTPVKVSSDEDDDSDILYSLNLDCDNGNLDDVTNKEESSHKKKKTKVKSKTEEPKSVINNDISNKDSLKSSKKDGKKRKTKISLIDSKKKSKDLLTTSSLMHSVSPPPMFTTVKHLVGSPDTRDPSEPSGNCHQEPVSPEASETYLADVPSSYPVPAEEPHSSEQSLSPRSLSYNSLLDSLPDQLHPSHKGAKKNKNNSSCVSNSDAGSVSPTGAIVATSVGGEQVERRTSVRSTECAFRYKQIVVKKCVHYTQIWLNTQTVMKNALNPQVIQEVVSALNSAKYDDSHLVLFSSLGNVFCSGTDLHFLVSGDRKMSARQMADAIRELTKTVITFPKPIIAAVSGAAVGMGVSLLALCDVVYASDKASFHLPYSQLSQTPEGCSSFTLPLTLGLPSANELLFGGRKITAMEAYQLGLVSQVFWPTLMMQEVIPRAQNMATCSAKALEATKLLVRSHHRTKMELTNETECNLLLERWLSVDCQRAIEAYLSNEKNLAF